MKVSVELFKQAVGSFPTGVTITTTFESNDRVVGMTASAFTSVSLDPLLILMCPSKHADCYSSLTQSSFFSVHLLGEDQGPLACRFAESSSNKANGLTITRGPKGSPRIDGCLAYLECRHYALYDGGDHGILLGEVMYIDIPEPQRSPLAYCRGVLGPLSSLAS